MNNNNFEILLANNKIQGIEDFNLKIISDAYFPFFNDQIIKISKFFKFSKFKTEVHYNQNINIELLDLLKRDKAFSYYIYLYIEIKNISNINDFLKYLEDMSDILIKFDKRKINFFINDIEIDLLNIFFSQNQLKLANKKIIRIKNKLLANNINIISHNKIIQNIGFDNFYDTRMWDIGKIPFNPDFSNIFFLNFLLKS